MSIKRQASDTPSSRLPASLDTRLMRRRVSRIPRRRSLSIEVDDADVRNGGDEVTVRHPLSTNRPWARRSRDDGRLGVDLWPDRTRPWSMLKARVPHVGEHHATGQARPTCRTGRHRQDRCRSSDVNHVTARPQRFAARQ